MKKNIQTKFRIGCYDGEWREMYFVANLGWVPQFSTTIDYPECKELTVPTNSDISHSYL